MNDKIFANASPEWGTPQDLFDSLNTVFGFTLDACATAENAKCQQFYTRDQDGLTQPWEGMVWCNPPYGRGLGKWVEKACNSRATVVMLVPAYTSNAWWHKYVIPHGEVILLRGRLQFGGVPYPAPFSSAIVIFGRDRCGASRHLKQCIGCKDFFLSGRSDATRCSGKCRMANSRAIARKAKRRKPSRPTQIEAPALAA
jgi:phage N-6-adenine-methyltransferase